MVSAVVGFEDGADSVVPMGVIVVSTDEDLSGELLMIAGGVVISVTDGTVEVALSLDTLESEFNVVDVDGSEAVACDVAGASLVVVVSSSARVELEGSVETELFDDGLVLDVLDSLLTTPEVGRTSLEDGSGFDGAASTDSRSKLRTGTSFFETISALIIVVGASAGVLEEIETLALSGVCASDLAVVSDCLEVVSGVDENCSWIIDESDKPTTGAGVD